MSEDSYKRESQGNEQKGNVILRFVNRKFASSAVVQSRNQKNSNDYNNIYIN